MSRHAVFYVCPNHGCDMKPSKVNGYWHCPEGCLWDASGENLELIVKPEPCNFHAFGMGRCTCEGASHES